MDDARHTPGPWKPVLVGRGTNPNVGDWEIDGPGGRNVASYLTLHDAKVVSAALDLLAYAQAQELRKSGADQPFGHDCKWCGHCVERLEEMRRAAIAKATQ